VSSGAGDDPFLVLGLPRRADLTDDDVRAAWRRIAAATHPDRDDGGDPARFGAAAAAYALLRTAYDRGETLANLDPGAPPRSPGPSPRPRARAGRLALRAGVTVAVGAGAFAAAGWAPASIGVAAGALTWLAVTAPHDLPPRPSRR
jgi:curved DNA-binding protein CbpA